MRAAARRTAAWGVGGVLVLAAAAVGLAPTTPLTPHVLAEGPTEPLSGEGAVLYGHVWVKQPRWTHWEVVVDDNAGSPEVLTEAGETLTLPPPWRWRPVPGVAIGGREWHTVEGPDGERAQRRARAVRAGDPVCTDGTQWWMASCAAVEGGRRDARTAALLLLLSAAVACGIGGAYAR